MKRDATGSAVRRRLGMAVAAVALGGAAAVAVSAGASADEAPTPAFLATAPGIQTFAHEMLPTSDNPIGLRSWPHGVCADARENDAYIGNCYGGPHQRFYLRYLADGQTEVENVANPGWCLDSNGAGEVYTTRCDAGNLNQHWKFTADYSRPDGRAVLSFQSQTTARYLVVAGGDLRTSSDATFDKDFAIDW